jgi:hypothetical protein
VVERGISAIAITDHNGFGGIEGIVKAAEGTNVVVFPGVEITAQGGHVLAIFNPSTALGKLDDALTSCGIHKNARNKEEAIGKPFREVMRIIVKEYGGIAIAAHVDLAKGFLKTIDQGQLKMQIYNDENLNAMELADEKNIPFYVEGKDPNYNRSMACIQSSDAHCLDEIGRRTTLIKIDSVQSQVFYMLSMNRPFGFHFQTFESLRNILISKVLVLARVS